MFAVDLLIDELPARLERQLRDLLNPDEEVLVKLKGVAIEALVCTNQRVLVLKAGFLAGVTFGSNVFQLPYETVGAVEVKFHLFTGYFELSAGGMQNTAKSYWSGDPATSAQMAPNCVSLGDRKQANRFRSACSVILAQKNSPSAASTAETAGSPEASSPNAIIDTISRLGEMRDAGVITNEEFEAKKKDLLAKL